MNKPDDLEAVRQIATTLESLQGSDRHPSLRWVRQNLGMAHQDNPPPSGPSGATLTSGSSATPDIKGFIQNKSPKNDTQLAATVAYFYRFVAPEAERKEAITADDLLEACRKADRKRPARAAQTMVNAFGAGLFDKARKGAYRLNSVGEDLVAMGLSGEGGPPTGTRTKSTKGTKRKHKGSRRGSEEPRWPGLPTRCEGGLP